MRLFIGRLLLRAGMAVLPRDVRELTRDLMMYHVPNGISVERRAELQKMKKNAGWITPKPRNDKSPRDSAWRAFM